MAIRCEMDTDLLVAEGRQEVGVGPGGEGRPVVDGVGDDARFVGKNEVTQETKGSGRPFDTFDFASGTQRELPDL